MPTITAASDTAKSVALGKFTTSTAPTVSAVPAVSAVPTVSAAPTVSAMIPDTTTNGCGPGAKRFEDIKVCMVFPEKPLEIRYEENEKGGEVELESLKETLLIYWETVQVKPLKPLRKEVEKIENPKWSEIKLEDGKHLFRVQAIRDKLSVFVTFTVKPESVEKAQSLIQSFRMY